MMRCVPPCKSKPSLMRSPRFCFTAGQDLGTPIRPKTQIKITPRIKTNFHLGFECIGFRYLSLECGNSAPPCVFAARLRGGLKTGPYNSRLAFLLLDSG